MEHYSLGDIFFREIFNYVVPVAFNSQGLELLIQSNVGNKI